METRAVLGWEARALQGPHVLSLCSAWSRGLSPVTPYNSGCRGPEGRCVEFLMDGAHAGGAGRADWCGTRGQYVEDNVCTDQEVRDGFEMVQAHYTDCAFVSNLMLPLI